MSTMKISAVRKAFSDKTLLRLLLATALFAWVPFPALGAPDRATLNDRIALEIDEQIDTVAVGGWLRTPNGDVQRTPDGYGVAGGNEPCDGCAELPIATSAMSESTGELGQSTAALEDGRFAAVWRRGGNEVLTQWLDVAGDETLETGGRLLGTDATDWAVVAPRTGGGAFVAWPSTLGVRVTALDAAANALWSVDAAPGADARSLQLLPRADGGVFACFETWERGVLCQRLAADGSRLWSDGVDVSIGDGYHVLPRLVRDGSGGVFVFWRDQRVVDDGLDQQMQIEGQRLAANGSRLWGAEGMMIRQTLLPESLVHRVHVLDAVTDGAGGAIVTFDDRFESSQLGVVGAQRVSATGGLPWGDGITAVSGEYGFAHEDTIEIDGGVGGGAVIAAREEIHGGLWRQWLVALDSSGASLWPGAVRLSASTDEGLDQAACLAVDAQGLLRVVWSRQAQPQTGGTLAIDVRTVRVDSVQGTLLDAQGGTVVADGPDAQLVRSIVAAPGGLLVTWDDRRSGTWNDLDVYATVIRAGGLFADGFESGDLSRWQ